MGTHLRHGYSGAKLWNWKKYRRFRLEQVYLRERWGREIASDPFYQRERV